jgi:hypothetical protein
MVTTTANYAFDKQSARSFDSDGRMRVRNCVLSGAQINPYYGREIPGWQDLGLVADKVYNLYRDPEALAAAADSFNGLPLMIRHIAQTADEPRKEHQGGSVFNVRYEEPYLRGDLLVSDGQAIEYVQSGLLADLSCSYRYKPEMIPGTVDGKSYDGRMVAIDGNHVALVEDGRASGAHVADSALSSQPGATAVSDNPDTREDKILHMLEAIDNRLTAIEGARANDAAAEAEKRANDEAEAEKKRAEDEAAEKAKKDEREGEERAMDAKIGAAVAAAVEDTNKKRDALEAAKRATRHVLGDTHAMDSAGAVYLAALKQAGVDVTAVTAGTEHVAWQAYQAGTAPLGRANDSRSNGNEPARAKFDTSRFSVRPS